MSTVRKGPALIEALEEATREGYVAWHTVVAGPSPEALAVIAAMLTDLAELDGPDKAR